MLKGDDRLEEYLQYLVEGDEHTLTELMNAYGKLVWNYAYVLTKNHHSADDITQDVFLQVYRKIKDFRGESSVKTWILTITRNMCYNHRNSSYFKRMILTERPILRNVHPSSEEIAISNAYSNDVWKIVFGLSKKHREIILLSAKYQLTTTEIAQLLHLSEGTVKSRLHRARTKISDKLGELS
jgi:RNA polymerase sigma-70 factor (ECF subfamily)